MTGRVAAGVRVVATGVALLAPGAGAGAQAPQLPPEAAAFAAMADAERAFARTAAAKGVRDAFIEWFDDDAVGFQPTLGRAQDQLRAQPPAADPLAAQLDWEPRAGDISRTGDFGWLTGPYTFRPPTGDPRYGCYFSVWIRTAAGWRVYMDIGAGTPGPVSFAPGLTRMAAPEGRFATTAADTAEAGRAASLAAGRALQTADDRANGNMPGSPPGGGESIVAAMDPEARLHRPGMPPIVGREAIRAHVARQPSHVRFAREGTRLAPGLDLAVTHGTFRPKPASTVTDAPAESASAAAQTGESGYYIRVWRRTADGRWLIVADLTQPGPAGQ